MQDNNQALEFIKALTGSDASDVTFQVFFDPKGEDAPKGLAETWTSSFSESLDFIDYKQSQQCGVYMCINGTDGEGREADNIVDLRVMFVDFDGMDEPEWSIQPHLIQSRDKTHGHAFWLIDAGDTTHDEWTILQRRMAMFYGSDTQVIDPARVVRIPGSLHLKNPDSPQMYNINENNTGNGHRYSIDDIRENHVLNAELDAELNQWVSVREGILDGTGYDDNKFEINKFVGFISNAAHPAVLNSGSHELFRVACFGHDHGVSKDVACGLLWEHYNPRCIPPWEDDERDNFEGVVYRAYRYPSSAAGCKTSKAQFNAAPPLQEPSCGWDGQALLFNRPTVIDVNDTKILSALPSLGSKVERDYRISVDNASVMSAQLTMKSSHYDFGLVYDGLKYDGVSLIKSKKQFYRFNSRSWDVVDDDTIKAEIQRSFSVYKPANAFTSGVYQVVCDLVNVENVENGTWLNNTEVDTSNLAVFQNGIVDLNSPDLKLLPHSHEFFTMNELNYDFDRTAKCPTWHEFLESIWGNDNDLKKQLQQFFGYCLTSDASLQKFAVFMGKSGAGKGTITDVLACMVGEDNMVAPTLPKIITDSALHEMSTASLTLIPDAHDVHHSIRDDVLSTLKAITGADPLSYKVMYKGNQKSRFKTKIVMSSNNVPTFNDPSGALVRRALVFPFIKSFTGIENHQLREILLAEVGGITQWAIEGLRELRANGGKFTESESGLREKKDLRRDMFPLSQYSEKSLEFAEGAFTHLDDLYNAYRLWAASEGVKTPMTKVVFNKSMRNSALPIVYENITIAGYHGVTIKSMLGSNNVVAMRP